MSTTRKRRWKRRMSDGAAFDADTIDDSSENHPRLSSISMPSMQVPSPLLNREPFRMTEEFYNRIAEATLSAITTFVVFGFLVHTEQQILPSAWIGNVIALTALKNTFGHTIITSKEILTPMVPVAIVSFGIVSVLESLDTLAYSIVLPFVVMVGSFVMYICPWPFIKMKNLMLVIFFISIASPLSLRGCNAHEEDVQIKQLQPWFVGCLVATCAVGVTIALTIHVVLKYLLPKKSAEATRLAPKLMNQLTFETNSLLKGVAEYTKSIGVSSKSARQARAVIEFYANSRKKTLKQLELILPALRAESNFSICSNADKYETLSMFIKCALKQQKHAELIKIATTQLLLGEEQTSQNDHVRQVKTNMSKNLANAFDDLFIRYCRSETEFLFGNDDTERQQRTHQELIFSTERYLKAMRQAIADAEAVVIDNDEASRSSAGPLIRSRVAFVAVYSFVHELLDAIADFYSKKMLSRCNEDTEKLTIMHRVISTLKIPWPYVDFGKRRLAIKTAFGMGLASLFVSVPYLRCHVAYPNAIWPAITVASVSLETSGSSYAKCVDRLWGTLIAAGVSLIMGKAAIHGLVKLTLVSLFTFCCIFTKDVDHAYASRYAATSVGSILYGSFYNNMEVDEYAPTRVMLIMMGAFIFLFSELIVFPRSSRTVVQAQSLQFFEDIEIFLLESSKVCRKIPSFHANTTTTDNNELVSLQVENPLFMLREGHKEIDLTDHLNESVSIVKETTDLTKQELKSGMSEPVLGLNCKLDPNGYEALVSEYSRCVTQANLLKTTLCSLAGFYNCMTEDNPARNLKWPDVLASSIMNIAIKLEKCADNLRQVFPHGVLRPGASKLSKIIRSVSIFREFEDTRLEILNEVADKYVEYMKSKDNVQYPPGFRLTLALSISALLSISKSLQKSGLHLETIIQSFPMEQSDIEEFTTQASASIQSDNSMDDTNEEE